MGLFDKFRKRVVEAEKEVGITVEEGSEEAKQAINEREIALSKKSNEAPEKLVIEEPKSEWDDIEFCEILCAASRRLDRRSPPHAKFKSRGWPQAVDLATRR